MEEWREIPGFENYLASNTGKIYSKNVKREIKQEVTKDGYLKCNLYKNGKRTTKKVHQFIAMTFIPNPKNKPQINHIDNNRKNNNVNNLEWVTASENMKHAVKFGNFDKERINKNNKKIIEKYGYEYYRERQKKNSLKGGKKAKEILGKKVALIDENKNIIEIYKSIGEAAKQTHTSRGSIRKSIRTGEKLRNGKQFKKIS